MNRNNFLDILRQALHFILAALATSVFALSLKGKKRLESDKIKKNIIIPLPLASNPLIVQDVAALAISDDKKNEKRNNNPAYPNQDIQQNNLKGNLSFQVISLRCSHLGCRLKWDNAKLWRCPCHGSSFSDAGIVLQGPATTDLTRYDYSIDNHNLIVIR